MSASGKKCRKGRQKESKGTPPGSLQDALHTVLSVMVALLFRTPVLTAPERTTLL